MQRGQASNNRFAPWWNRGIEMAWRIVLLSVETSLQRASEQRRSDA
ncbi:hypothetical protein RBSH_05113 [Rhodopirellula baltica SH28]|uniref:Uncharacterized protein n=1 Tax=Rhodopirellula baltica SH28 TaxID=993517 RepID=K5C902_RHOBT|nr:hypothetical protein RBSH_05113 [Rhodopirellula baltica SH28]